MPNIFSSLIGGSAQQAGAAATQSALDTLTQKPIEIRLSVHPDTQQWIAGLIVIGAIAATVRYALTHRK